MKKKFRKNRTKKTIHVAACLSVENNLEFIQTADMTESERIEWENKARAVALHADNGGILEMQKSCLYSVDKNGYRIPETESDTLFVAVCDDMGEDEICFTVSSKDEVRKLRDYLNKYLEDNF
ncbi:hypothetical protein [Parabacteroides merdae]|jgi:hypothetical protein|uniref:hypothetical protein n=1 Tax=Parabacteroides merdae TaxID=46503 RepID=UPI0018999024|nr:hypothetical protein [Parabacteroides merdae]MDB8904245.1 hypothetical protein [Parabacteroides merdae]MDB8907818.1 hypothetical protein [Parabacteroides merdae]DAI36329.1 MAG TPA: hypothetical protein [Caudoviricetes sp.]DAL75393.1 MAG TPA: hypothetical protein [Bacteriophage sp.]